MVVQHHKHIRWKMTIGHWPDGSTVLRLYSCASGHDLDTDKKKKSRYHLGRKRFGRSAALLAFMLFITAFAVCTTATLADNSCQRNYTIRTSGHIYSVRNVHFTIPYNYSDSVKHCQKLKMDLPMTLNNRDFSWFRKDMLDCGQISTWFGMQRVHLTASKYEYKWIDNKTHDIATMMPKPSDHRAMECGRIRLSTGEVSNMWCGTRDHGAICQFSGSCPPFSSPYNCYHNNTSTDNVYRTFHSALANWFAAKAICQQQGGDLAVFKTKAELNSMIEFITNQTQKDLCDDYWVGLRRATWHYTSDLANQKDFFPIWHIDQPNGYKFENNRPEVHNCAAVVEMDDIHGWRAENCAFKHHVTCQKIKKQMIDKTTPVTGSTVSPYSEPEPATSTSCVCLQPQDKGNTLVTAIALPALGLIIIILLAITMYLLCRYKELLKQRHIQKEEPR